MADEPPMQPVSAALSLRSMVLRDAREQMASAAAPQAQAAQSADVILTLSAAAQRLSPLG